MSNIFFTESVGVWKPLDIKDADGLLDKIQEQNTIYLKWEQDIDPLDLFALGIAYREGLKLQIINMDEFEPSEEDVFTNMIGAWLLENYG